ncbi:tetratricopeptide repeat protein [Crocinitomix catalasitica]|nr:tetratricopeptide repeat protein [Crocinitomix catalasitica]
MFIVIGILLLSCGNSKDAANSFDPAGLPPPNSKFKETFHQALLEKTIGHYDKAIPLFEQCLSLNPKSSASCYALSDLHEIRGDMGKAVEYAQKAYDLDNTNKWYSMRLAQLHFSLGNFNRSSDYFAKIIEDEKNIDVKYQYAEALIYAGRPQKAIDMLNEIEVETGKIPEVSLTKHDLYCELEDFEAAEQELQALIDENPLDLENYLIIADYFLNTKNPKKAEIILGRAQEINPNSGELRVMLADISLRNGDVSGAFENLKVAFDAPELLLERKIELVWGLSQLAFNPSNPDGKEIEKGVAELFEAMYDESAKNSELHNKYGIFLVSSQNKTKAREQFEIAVELKPDTFYAWRELLNLDFEMADFKSMQKHAERAVELFPAQPMFYLLNGIANYKEAEYEKAMEMLYFGKDIVVADPEMESEFLYHMGKSSCLRKSYDEGYGYFKEALEADNLNGKVHYEKTKFLLEEGKVNQALEEIKTALRLYPNDSAILDAEGFIFMSKKEYAKALISFETALKNDATNSIIIEHYGDALFLTGDADKAVEIWKDAVYYGARSELINRKITDKMYYEK